MKRKGKSRKNKAPCPQPDESKEMPEGTSRNSLRLCGILLLLLILTGAVYCQVARQDFTIWDDMDNIVTNPDFNPPTAEKVLKYWSPKNTARGLYAPATYTVWGIVSLVDGKGVGTPPESPLNPHAFHVLNLASHILSVWVVFLLLRSLLRHVAVDEKHCDWAAFAGALLFAFHPVQVEPIGWISGTKDLLCGLFTIIAVWQYIAYVQTTRYEAEGNSLFWFKCWHPRYLISVVACLLAMFAKPTGVVTPLVAGGLAFFALKRSFWRVVLDQLPLLILAGVFVLLNKTSQQQGQDNQIPFWIRPFIAGDAISFYLYKLLIPIKLCIHYGRNPEHWYRLELKYLTGALPYVLLAMVLEVMWLLKFTRDRLRWVLAGAAVFVAGVLPVLGFVGFMFQRHSTVADHYLYISMLGPALVLAYLLAGKRHSVWWGLAVCWLCVLGVLAVVQTSTWKNSETLFRHTTAANPESWVGYNNLAKIERDKGNLEESANLCRKALKINPLYAHAYTNLGLALIDMDQLEEGMKYLSKGYELEPAMERFVNTAAKPLYVAGTVYESKGDLAKAIEQYRKALYVEPNNTETLFRLGICLKNSGQPVEAEAELAKAAELEPDNARTRFNLALVLAMQNKAEPAMEQYREAIRIDPTYAHAHNNLGLLYERRGELAQAAAHYEKAVQNAPDMAPARTNLERVQKAIKAAGK